MEYFFRLNCKPFSVNAYHFAQKRYKTPEARAWEGQVLAQLVLHSELGQLKSAYEANGGHFILKLDAYYPKHIFFTESGEISGRTIDTTNWEKPLQDLIFKVMQLNDKLVKRVESEKHESSHHFITVSICLVPGPGLQESRERSA